MTANELRRYFEEDNKELKKELKFTDYSSIARWSQGTYMLYETPFVSMGEGDILTETEALEYCNTHIQKEVQ